MCFERDYLYYINIEPIGKMHYLYHYTCCWKTKVTSVNSCRSYISNMHSARHLFSCQSRSSGCISFLTSCNDSVAIGSPLKQNNNQGQKEQYSYTAILNRRVNIRTRKKTKKGSVSRRWGGADWLKTMFVCVLPQETHTQFLLKDIIFLHSMKVVIGIICKNTTRLLD